MDSLAQDFSEQHLQLLLLLSIFGVPHLLGLPFSQCDLFPSLCNARSGLGGNICNTPWQQKWGHDLQMCWETSSASSWGCQAFRICGGGAPPFPLSDTGSEECPGLNGPCVKSGMGGRAQVHPLRQGQNKRQLMGWAALITERSHVEKGLHRPSLLFSLDCYIVA